MSIQSEIFKVSYFSQDVKCDPLATGIFCVVVKMWLGTSKMVNYNYGSSMEITDIYRKVVHLRDPALVF